MTTPIADICSSFGKVRSEQLIVELQSTTILAARYAAQHDGVTLDAWIDKVVLDRALSQQARLSAEFDLEHPEEGAEWREYVEAHLFGEEPE